MEAFKHRVKIEMEINLGNDGEVQEGVFMVAKEAEHVRKLNKKTEETCERETYYLLTKKSRKLKKRKIACKWKDYHDTEDEHESS